MALALSAFQYPSQRRRNGLAGGPFSQASSLIQRFATYLIFASLSFTISASKYSGLYSSNHSSNSAFSGRLGFLRAFKTS